MREEIRCNDVSLNASSSWFCCRTRSPLFYWCSSLLPPSSSSIPVRKNQSFDLRNNFTWCLFPHSIGTVKEVDEHLQNDRHENSEEFDEKGKWTCRHVCYTACQFVNCADGECPENSCICLRCNNGTSWHIGGELRWWYVLNILCNHRTSDMHPSDLVAGLGDDARHRLERELPKGAVRFLLRATAASIIGK